MIRLITITNDQLLNGLIPDELLPVSPAGIMAGAEMAPIEINLSGCASLTRLPENLPERLALLDLKGCTSLTHLPVNLPARLISLDLNGCTSLTHLPELPAGLTVLDLRECTSLRQIPDALPLGLTMIYLRGCASLTHLPDNLPARLTWLVLEGCTSLTHLPDNLPEGLTRLHLGECTSLIPTPELLQQLATLSGLGCDIRPPNHFINAQSDSVKAELNTSVEEYRTLTKQQSDLPRIKELMGRFLDEGVNSRGGLSEIISATRPTIELIKQNPLHLEWIENIATGYLSGCVNQPVTGLSEISCFVAIANANGIKEKLEAAKQLMVFEEVIKYEITKSSPGKMFEVEAVNTLYRVTHANLLEEDKISTPWPGVPGPVRWEASIRNWLTDERVSETIKRAENILIKPLKFVADYIFTTHEPNIRINWANTAFPEEIKGIKALAAAKRELLGEVEDLSEEELTSLKSSSKCSIEQMAIQKYIESKDREGFFNHLEKDLYEEISGLSKDLTYKAVGRRGEAAAEEEEAPSKGMAPNTVKSVVGGKGTGLDKQT